MVMRSKQAGTVVNHSSFQQLDNQFETQPRPVRLTQTVNIDIDEKMVDNLRQVIEMSSQYDSIKVVERLGQYLEKYGKHYDTVPEALSQFIQTRPSDEKLLHEQDYITERKVEIQKNLEMEIARIDTLMPSSSGTDVDYYSYKKKQGQKMLQHFRKLFNNNRKIDETPDQFLEPFLKIYKEQLNKMMVELMRDSNLRSRLALSTVSASTLNNLGSRPRSNRITQSAVDEKMILDEKRRLLHDLELLVLKMVIAVERINYYTMGIILPRDQNLKVIPFFESQKDPIYDIQSCLKIQSLIKHQIERLEQIERQLSPRTQKPPPLVSQYFSRSKDDLKDKHEFRENFHSKQSSQRCFDIWHEFLEDKSAEGHLSHLKLNLCIKVAKLDLKFESLKHKLTIQLFYKPSQTVFPQIQLQNHLNSWLFTEIPFAKNLLQEDLVMIIKVFKTYDIKPSLSKPKQKVNSKTNESQKISLLKAYQVINLSDKFFEEKMKDGRVFEPSDVIRFFHYDPKYNLDQDYDRILKDLKENEFTGQFDDELTSCLSLKLQYTFLSSINRNMLSLRLDQAQIIRQKYYWDKMVKEKEQHGVKLHHQDPLLVFRKEMEQLNYKELKKSETLNELRININQLTIEKSKIQDYQVYRVQVFLVFNDKQHKSNINLKFLESYYQYGLKWQQKTESHQTHISTLKKGTAYFRTECHLRVPITLKQKDLQNYKLVFVVYVAGDLEKKNNRKVTESMVEQDPLRYPFYPFYFAKQSLWENGQIIGGPLSETVLPLMKFNSSKHLHEQIDLEQEQMTGTYLTANIVLASQQYSTSEKVNRIIEPTSSVEVLEAVNSLTNNEVLVYHTRLMYSLLHQYNNSDTSKSNEALKAILLVFKRFQTKEMLPYRPLIQEYSERWKGDRDNDKRLLKRLTIMLEKIPETISECLQSSLDQPVSDEIKIVEQKLIHMPALLVLVCRLFSREFQQQYASIREKMNTQFRPYLNKNQDLCMYRPDLIDNSNTQKRKIMCSKPATIIQQLFDDIGNLQRKILEQQQQSVAEESEDDSDGIDSLLEENADNFQNRVSQYQIRRSTITPEPHNDQYLNQLKKAVNELKGFQQEFSRSIKNMIVNTSRYLHEEVEIPKDNIAFCDKIEKIINLQKSDKLSQDERNELDQMISEITEPYRQNIQSFPFKARSRLNAVIERRKDLRMIFWKTLQPNLHAILNFIDRKFVLAVFDDKFLLKKFDSSLDKVVKNQIPYFDQATKTYGQFNSALQAHDYFKKIKADFEQEVKEAVQKNKELKDFEDKEIEKSIQQKVIMLSDFLASDTLILLPSDQDDELIQEQLATKLQVSVYQHLKQYKNQWREETRGQSSFSTEKIKDTTSSELQYLFLYKMSVFEKKFHESKINAFVYDEERPSHLSMLVDGNLPKSFKKDRTSLQQQTFTGVNMSYRSIVDFDDFDDEMLNGLSSSRKQTDTNIEIIEETKDMPLIEEALEFEVEEPVTVVEPLTSTSKQIIRLNDSMKLGLGAKQEHLNFKDRQDQFFTQFDNQQDRRLCYFLNEMEEAMSKYWELKEGSQFLSVHELKEMKSQYISLFQVLQLQHLSNLSNNAFKLLYDKRPGCLDRLIKQVRLTTSLLEFDDHEMFFSIKKLQVIEGFCKNVIDSLCDPQNKKYISELQDKYTYKSIVSQVSVLTLTLFAEQAQVLYDYQSLGSILKGFDSNHQKAVDDFSKRLRQHSQTQISLWSSYKDMGDMILPDEQIDLYSGIQGRLKKVLCVDLEDNNIDVICGQKLKNVLLPLALMMVQIDELTYKSKQRLSHRVFSQMERFFKEFIDYYTTSGGQHGLNDQKRNHIRQKNKKKQICEFFCASVCHEYVKCTKQVNSEQFQKVCQQRVQEITLFKELYLNVIEYEKLPVQDGNLLAQLISYYELMQNLQVKNLSVSFQNNIKLKYRQMIENINSQLKQSYLKEMKMMEEDDSHICQKQPSQYLDQMREVRAFCHVEDYLTYRGAMDQGLMESLGNEHNVKTLESIITDAVSVLVQQQDNSSKVPPNQFFDVALKLLSDKRALQETNYDFRSVIHTLNEQTTKYEMYEKFEQKSVYCVYYRIKIDAFLPESMREKDRHFIYRTPSGYNQEFIKHDLACLLGNEKVTYSKECEVKPLQPLSYEVRHKYNILPNTKNLSETPEEINQLCPQKFRNYFRQNFKKQFFVEQCPSLDPAGFDEEYVITIYEVKKTFPTMTMIQQVYRSFEKRIPRVKIELWTVQMIMKEIQTVLRFGTTNKVEGQQKKPGEALSLEDVIQKYITNDDVGGGQPKMLDLFFSDSRAQAFIDQENIELKRAYLDLFKEIEKWLSELQKVVEMFSTVGHNVELTKMAEERLEDRMKVLNERRTLYKLSLLQENF